MPERGDARGLLDTSVIIDLGVIDVGLLPPELAISSITLAELAAGTHATSDIAERGARQYRLQRVEASFRALPFDSAAARAYGRVWAEVAASGRKPRGGRAVDLLIAATALACDMPLWTRNGPDFAGLESLLEVIAI